MSLDQLLATSDVISLHVPLSPQTRHLIDRTALSRMKRSAYLINTSRGPVVDEDALGVGAARRDHQGRGSRRLRGRAQVHPGLLALENVVLVPHMASATAETRAAMYDLVARNVVNVLKASRPSLRYRKNVEAGDAPACGGHHRPRTACRREDLPVARGGSLPGHDRNAAVRADAGRDDLCRIRAAVQKGCDTRRRCRS